MTYIITFLFLVNGVTMPSAPYTMFIPSKIPPCSLGSYAMKHIPRYKHAKAVGIVMITPTDGSITNCPTMNGGKASL